MDHEYIFLSYNPILSFSSKTFKNSQGKPITINNDYEKLFFLGKDAFDLLKVDSNLQLTSLTQDYFSHIKFLLEVIPILEAKGRLRLKSETNEEINYQVWINQYKNPDKYQLIEIAPTLFKVGYNLARELTLLSGKDDLFDLKNDICTCYLIHVLIEIDNAIIASQIGSDDLIQATQEASSALVLAGTILEQIDFERRLRSTKAKFAASKRHETSSVAKSKIIEIWKSGKYSSRDVCAEQEAALLNISFSTARKALRNIQKT